ncbi:hypothetical protein K491DRAFT_83586 [Lophiostoma macrostomum CBS 122681]|uniref:Uncharacterized protein n=1 Tax=Lophiostoma macrostomum CBS 122681 TaxID=1314788 RepID=A0A6A6SXD9_9PLEO|nr:hypothetical protein K491DRAFT_83586 [Lophiostoma macrostomum CBS 122681]
MLREHPRADHAGVIGPACEPWDGHSSLRIVERHRTPPARLTATVRLPALSRSRPSRVFSVIEVYSCGGSGQGLSLTRIGSDGSHLRPETHPTTGTGPATEPRISGHASATFLAIPAKLFRLQLEIFPTPAIVLTDSTQRLVQASGSHLLHHHGHF